MVEQLDRWIASVGPLAYLVLGLSAMIEYIFPPFPGDTLTLIGGVYAARGQKPWWLVLATITAGSMLGAMVDYWIGTRLDRWLRHQPPEKRFLGMTWSEVAKLEERMRRRGKLLVLINRFLPGVRGPIFFAAGVARLPIRHVLVLGTISSLVFNLLVLGLGIMVGGNAEHLEQLLHRYQEGVYLLAGVLGLLLLLRFLWFRKKAKRGAERIERQ